MQETLLAAAENAGAEMRRGVSVKHVERGVEPTLIVDVHSHERISARLVVAADGRGSAVRKWTGFSVCEQSYGYYMAGVLLTNVPAPSEIFYAVFNSELGAWTGLIPQVGDRFRACFVYPKTMGYRLQGESMLNLFIRSIPYHRKNDSHRLRVDYQVGSYGSGENLLFIGGESVSTPAQSRTPSRTPRGIPPPSHSDEGPMQDCSALPHSVA
jgi:2-polyprenyl-6-methoxyphenol hydroxylase-like FAD-dependent oxidoreductase